MSAKLGRLFLHAALGPLNHAGRCLMAGQVHAGLDELTRDSLWGAFERGVSDVAAAVGATKAAVLRELPAADLEAVMSAIETQQEQALAQWHAHAGPAGSMLLGLADLTDDGRPPDVALCLERLAKRMHRDKELAAPLQTLSSEMAHWRTLLEECRTRVETADSLGKAYRRRVRLRVGLLGASALALLVAGILITRRELARSRIRAALADGTCGVERIDHDDVGRADAAMQSEVREARARCEAERAAQAKREQEARRAAERAAAEQKRKKTLAKACASLGRDVEADTLDGARSELVGTHGPLLQRIASGVLDPADVGEALEELPCSGTDGGRQIRKVFARAMVTSAPGWILTTTPSERAQQWLVEHHSAISPEALAMLDLQIEKAAQQAVVSGQKEDVLRSKALCELKKELELAPRADCTAALALSP